MRRVVVPSAVVMLALLSADPARSTTGVFPVKHTPSGNIVVRSLTVGATPVGLSGQSGAPPSSLRTSERQNVMGRIKVESSAAGRTRIQFWLNTPSYLAKSVELESDGFAISQERNGGVLIESAGPVRVTGFTLGQDVSKVGMLQNAEGNLLTWDSGFQLRIRADGTPAWGCCPRKE